MSVNFDIKINCIDEFGKKVSTNKLNEIKCINSFRPYSPAAQLVSYSIHERTGEDVTQVRAELLGKIQIIFENKVPYDSQANDVYSLSGRSPEEFLKVQADQLINPKGVGRYLLSYVYNTEYQAHVMRTYKQVCEAYLKLKQ